MKIAVGSVNPTKIAAATNAIRPIWPDAEVLGVEAPSGVSVQPMSDDEAILGAHNRAVTALDSTAADLGIGIEGNVHESPHGMFATGWAVIVDRTGRVGIGAGGRLQLPTGLAAEIRRGRELGPLMDELTGETNLKHRQGAVGILTGGAVNRVDALQLAVTFALTRFIVPRLYGDQ